MKALQKWAKEERADSIEEYVEINNLIDEMLAANKQSRVYQQETLERVLNRLLYLWVIRSKKVGYLLEFPKVCRYRWRNMTIFLKEFLVTAKGKIKNSWKENNLMQGKVK